MYAGIQSGFPIVLKAEIGKQGKVITLFTKPLSVQRWFITISAAKITIS
jgi:hypothetical protein